MIIAFKIMLLFTIHI